MFRKRLLTASAGLAALLALTGCVAYPADYYGGPVYAAPRATVVVPIVPYGGYYRGGYGGGYRGGYGGGYGGYRGGGWR